MGVTETKWLRTEFAIPSGDRCQCHQHWTSGGNSKRCSNRDCVIMLTHPETGANRLYCLDCWALCREEKNGPNPAQQRMYERIRRDGAELIATGC